MLRRWILVSVVVGVYIVAYFAFGPVVGFRQAIWGGRHDLQVRTELRPMVDLEDVVVLDKTIRESNSLALPKVVMDVGREEAIGSKQGSIVAANCISHSMRSVVSQDDQSSGAESSGGTIYVQCANLPFNDLRDLTGAYIQGRRFSCVREIYGRQQGTPILNAPRIIKIDSHPSPGGSFEFRFGSVRSALRGICGLFVSEVHFASEDRIYDQHNQADRFEQGLPPWSLIGAAFAGFLLMWWGWWNIRTGRQAGWGAWWLLLGCTIFTCAFTAWVRRLGS